MLGTEFAVLDRVEPVDVEGLAVLATLYDALSCVIIEKVDGLAVVVYLFYSVFFVPDDSPLLAGGLAFPSGHIAAGIVAVDLISCINDSVRLICAVGVAKNVVGLLRQCDGRGRLDDLVDLGLPAHVADRVIAESVGVVILLAGAEPVCSLGSGNLIEVVVPKALGHGACGEGGVGSYQDAVYEVHDVSDQVVVILKVLDLPAALDGIERGDEGVESSGLVVVGVVGDGAVPVCDMGPLAKLVIEQAVYVVVPAAVFSPQAAFKRPPLS